MDWRGLWWFWKVTVNQALMNQADECENRVLHMFHSKHLGKMLFSSLDCSKSFNSVRTKCFVQSVLCVSWKHIFQWSLMERNKTFCSDNTEKCRNRQEDHWVWTVWREKYQLQIKHTYIANWTTLKYKGKEMGQKHTKIKIIKLLLHPLNSYTVLGYFKVNEFYSASFF